MSDEPDPTPLPTSLQGTLLTITMYKAPLLIGKVLSHGTEVAIIGNVTSPPGRGSKVDLTGKYRESPAYGLQFSFTNLIEHLPETTDRKGILRFLADKCKGIGPKRAEKLYDKFGEKTLQAVASNSPEVQEILGMKEETCQHNAEIVSTLLVSDKIRIPLLSWGFAPSIIDRVNDVFKEQAEDIVTNDPYQLVSIKGIGFETLDKVLTSRKIVEPNSERRGMALCYHILKEEINQRGNTIVPLTHLLSTIKSFNLVTPISVQAVIQGLHYGIKIGTLTDTGDGNYTLPDIGYCENCIAACLSKLAALPPSDILRTQLSTAAWELQDPAPNALQIKAVSQVATNRVSIITGGPGTGKTFTLRGLIQSIPKGLNIALMAPTGKAAKRMGESLKGLKVPHPTTIHKFLRQRPEDVDSANLKGAYANNNQTQSTFERKQIKPDLVVIDETSMVDIHLFSHLLAYIGTSPHLVIIGDVDQLPSIGPGLVLADLINSNKFSAVRLLKNERQVEGSAILTNAYNVLGGQHLTPDNGTDWRLDLSDHASDLVKPLLLAIASYKAQGFDPIKQIQVLCPQHRGSMGTHTLNSLIRDSLNPRDASKPELFDKDGTSLFRLGDKVVSTKNHHLPNADPTGEKEVYVVNGDTGIITELKISTSISGVITKVELTVDFETHQAKYIQDRVRKSSVNTLDTLQQAWAMSVHKSQGSEYPVVLISLTNEVFMELLNRPLLYTAITRGKTIVHVFASQKSIFKAISNTTPSQRNTQLKNLIIKACS